MATVQRVIQFDAREADVIHRALHSQATRAALDAVRARLGEPLVVPPVGTQTRPGSLTTRVRAGVPVDDDLLAALIEASHRRRVMLAALAAALGDPDGVLADAVAQHEEAIGALQGILAELGPVPGPNGLTPKPPSAYPPSAPEVAVADGQPEPARPVAT